MSLIKFSIKRPAFAIVINLAMIISGVVCASKIQLRQYPDISPSTISVETSWKGAYSDLVEKKVTKPIEQAIRKIKSVDTITSNSSQGKSSVTVTFKGKEKINDVLVEAINQVNSIKATLPLDIDDPTIKTVDPAARPLMYLAWLGGDKKSLTKYYDDNLKNRINNLNGVGSTILFGRKQDAIRVYLDPVKLHKQGLSAVNTTQSIISEIQEVALGKWEGPWFNYPVKLIDYQNPEQLLKEIPIKKKDGTIIKSEQIANIELGSTDDTSSVEINGKDSTVIGVTPSQEANPIALSDEINQFMKNSKESLLPYSLTMVYNGANYIKESLAEMKEHILQTFFIVILVTWLFIGSFRLSVIPIAAIPTSILGTIGLIWLLGFSLNTFTLLALILAIGMVVDDAIVIGENIYKKIEHGLSPKKCGNKGGS